MQPTFLCFSLNVFLHEKNRLQKFLKVQKFRKLGLAKIGQHSYAHIHHICINGLTQSWLTNVYARHLRRLEKGHNMQGCNLK